MKDWNGNKNSARAIHGIGKNGDRQENDFYATNPIAAEALCDLENLNENIWECCCGEGHLSKVFVEKGYNVKSTDIVDRGYGQGGQIF